MEAQPSPLLGVFTFRFFRSGSPGAHFQGLGPPPSLQAMLMFTSERERPGQCCPRKVVLTLRGQRGRDLERCGLKRSGGWLGLVEANSCLSYPDDHHY